MAKVAASQTVTVDGRSIKVTNLDKVLYPDTGTTKGEVLAYYAAIGPTMIPHLRDRPATRKRWPDGVGDARGPNGGAVGRSARGVFFNKDLGAGTPEWVARHSIAHRDHDSVYPVVNDLATLTWLAQLAALEIHVPQWRFDSEGHPQNPDRLVLDLDPGPGVTLADCAEIARLARDLLREIGLESVPVTSGSKGIHLYAPLDGSPTSADSTAVAHELAQALEADHPDRVVSQMKRSERDGKVFLDWSQNNGNKTTVSPYSLRGRNRPTVAAPRDWTELDSPDLAQLDYHDVLARMAESGDLLAALVGEVAPADRTDSPETPARSRRRSTPPASLPAAPPDPEPVPGIAPASPTSDQADFPAAVEPMLATATTRASFGDQAGWAFEMKWDGVRVVAYVAGGRIRLLSRRGRDDTAAYGEIAAALAEVDVQTAVLDGEIVVLDPSGRPDFGLLQNRINLTRPADIERAARTWPAHLMLFDVLELNGRSLVSTPYEGRREVLESLTGLGPRLQIPPTFDGDLDAALATSRELRLEGVVAKRRTSTYQPGRRAATWLKLKEHRNQEVVVGGWRPGHGRRDGGVGSLLLGIPTAEGLRYVGRVGSGFTERRLTEMQALVDARAEDNSPFTDVPRADARDAHWVTPDLVGEVTYGELTGPGRLRHPVWRGLRPDKSAADVGWEHPA